MSESLARQYQVMQPQQNLESRVKENPKYPQYLRYLHTQNKLDPFNDGESLHIPNLADLFDYTRTNIRLIMETSDPAQYEWQLKRLERFRRQDLMAMVIYQALKFIGLYKKPSPEELEKYLLSEAAYPIPLNELQKEIIKKAVFNYTEARRGMDQYRTKFKPCAGEVKDNENKKAILVELGIFDKVDPNKVSIFFEDLYIHISLDDNSFNEVISSYEPNTPKARIERYNACSEEFLLIDKFGREFSQMVSFARKKKNKEDEERTKMHERSHIEFAKILNPSLYSQDNDSRHYGEDLAFYLKRLQDELVAYMRANIWKFNEALLLSRAIDQAELNEKDKTVLKYQFNRIIIELKRLRREGYSPKSLYLKILTAASIEDATLKLKMIEKTGK